MGTVEIKPMKFVDDIADLNSGSENAANSNKIIVGIQGTYISHLLLKNHPV